MSSSPSQRTPRTAWENGLPTIPTAAYLVAEGISPTTGPGREGREKTPKCLLSLHVACGVCNEVWWRPHPTNLPPPPHCFAQCAGLSGCQPRVLSLRIRFVLQQVILLFPLPRPRPLFFPMTFFPRPSRHEQRTKKNQIMSASDRASALPLKTNRNAALKSLKQKSPATNPFVDNVSRIHRPAHKKRLLSQASPAPSLKFSDASWKIESGFSYPVWFESFESDFSEFSLS